MSRQRAARVNDRAGLLATRAYDLLKAQIIRCELAPGQQVTEAELVALTQLGKTPVREALGRLRTEQLVQSIPRLGYQVAPITLGDIRQLFGLRIIVEPAAARMAAGRVDAQKLRRLDELCQAGYNLGDHKSASQFLVANYELHATIADASGNPRLAAVVRATLENSERYFHVGLMLRNRSDEMAHEHRDLVEALEANDGEAAGRITAEQIVAAERMVTDAILGSPSLQATMISLPEAP